MTKNNKQNEAIDTLTGWAEEDKDNRSAMIIVSDEDDVRIALNGSLRNLVDALTASILKHEEIREVCARAFAEADKVVNSEE